MDLFHIRTFPCHFALFLKSKLQHVGHIQIVLWVSGSSESTGVTQFFNLDAQAQEILYDIAT